LYPTSWQKKTLWNAITALSLLVICSIVVFAVYVAARTLAFLQPLLLPVAIAGVLAYLLDPAVGWLERRKIPRLVAVIVVFLLFATAGLLLFVGMGPLLYAESLKFSQALPGYLERSWRELDIFLRNGIERLPRVSGSLDTVLSQNGAAPPAQNGAKAASDLIKYEGNPYVQQFLNFLREQLPTLAQQSWTFLQSSLTGVFGAFGFLIGLLVVPVYLFFFLMEGQRIAVSWSNYLPIRKSEFKDEVVIVLTEINSYVINFFRGQLMVSMIDGVLTAIGLSILGLQFGFLIGLFLAFLGLMPFIGFALCYIPAVLIAFVQFNDWVHPLWVTIIFFIVQQIDGMVVAPRIVGNSVGLHPVTVILSVFFWTLVLGGLLGAVLAIPLTATLKVLLHRYVWDRERSIFFEDQTPSRTDEIEIAT
jgi:predicted PurR-regulated permease PerM